MRVAMPGNTLRRSIKIVNPQGLHMRPITAFVEVAAKFKSRVSLCKQNQTPIDGKSPLGLLGLAAEEGTVLDLEVDGPDAEQALCALSAILEKPSFDD